MIVKQQINNHENKLGYDDRLTIRDVSDVNAEYAAGTATQALHCL